MLERIAAVAKKMKGVMKRAVRPRTVKSLDEVSSLFKKEGITSVKVNLACYTTMAGLHKLTVDYIGDGKKKPIIRREVLRTIERQSTNEHIREEMRELYPTVRDRAEKLKNELGGSASQLSAYCEGACRIAFTRLLPARQRLAVVNEKGTH